MTNVELHLLAQALEAHTRALLVATDTLDLAAVLLLVDDVIEAADDLKAHAKRMEEARR